MTPEAKEAADNFRSNSPFPWSNEHQEHVVVPAFKQAIDTATAKLRQAINDALRELENPNSEWTDVCEASDILRQAFTGTERNEQGEMDSQIKRAGQDPESP